MHIVISHRNEWPRMHPAASFGIFNALALAKQGVETVFIVSKANNKTDEENLRTFFGLQPHKNLHIAGRKKWKISKIKSSLPFYLHSYRKIIKLSRKTHVDAIISRDIGFIRYMAKIRKKTGIPVFYETHNFFMEETPHTSSKGQMRTFKKNHKKEKKYIPRLSGMFHLIEPQKKLYQKHFPNQNSFVVHPGIIDVFEPEIPVGERKKISYIGDMSEKRDIPLLLEAFRKAGLSGYKLVLVGGKKAEIPGLKKLIQEMKLNGKVDITGWIPYKELEKMLPEFALGIVPMKDIFYNRYLTAPMKVFDYMSHGIPVLSADMPSVREFVEEEKHGMFYRSGDVEDLSEKLKKILASADSLNRMSENIIEKAKTMLWEKRAERIKQIVEGISRNYTDT